MFESMLESRALPDGDRRFGTLSAAALAHAGVALAIGLATAFVVPKVVIPEPPIGPFAIVTMRPIEPRADSPLRPPAPKKGNDAAKPGRAIVPRPAQPDVPPVATPDRLEPAPPDEAPDGPPGPGEGTQGDPNGSPFGTPGGTGTAAAGPGGDGGGEPAELTGEMVRPVLLAKVEPSYPRAARLAGLGGRVTLRAVIAEDGSVESVEVLASTNPLFNDAAVDAVRQWRYRPALMNGRPVRVFFTVRVDFLVR